MALGIAGKISTIKRPTFKFLHILPSDNVRVFLYGNKYLLVDPHDYAFMMFEIIAFQKPNSSRTIKYVDFPLNYHLSTFPSAQEVSLLSLSKFNLNYMGQFYLDSILRNKDTAFRARACKIKSRYNISLRFAGLLAKLPLGSDYARICDDIQEAAFYVQNNSRSRNILINGTKSEMKNQLLKLLSPETYDDLHIKYAKFPSIRCVVNEILSFN